MSLISKMFLSFLFILFMLTLFSCESSTEIKNDFSGNLEKSEEEVLNASQKFGLKIFKRITEQMPDSNVFISPLSISTAFNMALNGAVGPTYDEIYRTLELNDLTINEVNSASKSLKGALTSLDERVVFSMANSLWYREDLVLRQAFLQALTDYYYAQVEGLDFSDPATLEAINSWVEANTNGMIKKVLNEIDPAAVLFLINALYFKGTWQREFNPENTIDGSFFTREGGTVDVEMMVQKEFFQYFETDTFQAVDLPYGDGHYSMSVFLPKSNSDLTTVYSQLTEENWNNWITQFSEREILLIMPKFETEFGLELKDILIAMGMVTPFTSSADFTNLYEPGGLYISSVIHKTAIKVNEEGTEAAAVTVITFERTGNEDETEMQINRPFLYVIRENTTGTILFMGQVVNPAL